MSKVTYPETIKKSQAKSLDALRAATNDDSMEILKLHAANPIGWINEYAGLNDLSLRQLKRAVKYGYTPDIEVKRIAITRAEGPVGECNVPKYANSWEEANVILKDMALTASSLGYDKTDFEIYFSNGDIYRGRYDLTPEDRFKADLYKHVTDFCEFHGGICFSLPSHITREQYSELLGGYDISQYLLLLDNLIYPSSNKRERLDPTLLQNVKPSRPQEKEWPLPGPQTNFVLTKEEELFIIYSGWSRYTSFSSYHKLLKWMNKYGLTMGELIRENTYRINGAFREIMIKDRSSYLHLPQIAIKMNGCVVRAYKETTPEVTNIYVVVNYTEAFKFDYNKPSGLRYLRMFF